MSDESKNNKHNPHRMMIHGMVAALQEERRQRRRSTQMTLGKLIEVLEGMPGNTKVDNLYDRHSYRGYYEDLAFSLGVGTRPASELLEECRKVMGRALQGYKGGHFVMGELTPLWVAEYGCCGERLMSFDGGKAVTAPEEEDSDA